MTKRHREALPEPTHNQQDQIAAFCITSGATEDKAKVNANKAMTFVRYNTEVTDWKSMCKVVYDRIGEYPAIVPLDSPEGQALIEEGLDKTQIAYYSYFSEVIELIDERNANPDHLIDDQRFRDLCHYLGQFAGAATHLYDETGRGIYSHAALQDTLKTAQRKPNPSYVVPYELSLTE